MTSSKSVAPYVLAIYWTFFLGTKLWALFSGDWFVFNALTIGMMTTEMLLIFLLLHPRTARYGAILSVVILSGAFTYHTGQAITQSAPCNCTGHLRTTHIEMIPLILLGAALAVWALAWRGVVSDDSPRPEKIIKQPSISTN